MLTAVTFVALTLGLEPASAGDEAVPRFPPLQVPPGFEATLFASDPFIEYPSVIANGPRVRSIFLAQDYMTGLGTEIVRRDEIRLVEDTDGDGEADTSTLFAVGFNSIEGLAYHDGTVFAMHAPFLTMLRDLNDDGVADERRDLLEGLGLPPEKNPGRLHCANGVVAGHDGWLYLALGDNGCDVERPEGDRLVHEGGAILRCRVDGRDLHVFSYGLRNIYDIALDAQLDVFVRDNENDGGDYKIRVCHSFFGADHGYPYLYYERPDEALAPLADLALGSSAGGVCYLETAFPMSYRGDLFFCEWGRAVVRYRRERAGESFAPMREIDFATGAENDPYGFKPTDLVVDLDGALYVSDWADGQRPKRGRGRVYRITPVGSAASTPGLPGPDAQSFAGWIVELDSESSHQRVAAQLAIERSGARGLAEIESALQDGRLGATGRLHAIRVLALLAGEASIEKLLAIAAGDPDIAVRAQAIRALGDIADPVLRYHRLDAGRGDAQLAARLAAIQSDASPEETDERTLLETVVALGRLRWVDSPHWLRETIPTSEGALAHAAMQTLRRARNWPAVLKLLDDRGTAPARTIALRALSDRHHPVIVDGLISRLRDEPSAARRREYVDLLARVHRKPGPWVYWGYRPAPRSPYTVDWERTRPIEEALDRILARDPDRGVRTATLRWMQREKIPDRFATLAGWLGEEHDPDAVATILDSLRARPVDETGHVLASVIVDARHATEQRTLALEMVARETDVASGTQLLDLATSVEDGAVLATALRLLAKRPALDLVPLLVSKLDSAVVEVRVAAIESLIVVGVSPSRHRVRRLLDDGDVRVRRAAARAVGALGEHGAADALLALANDPDPATRHAVLDSLRQLGDRRVVPVARAALEDRETGVAALVCLAALGGPEHADAIAAAAGRIRSKRALGAAIDALVRWRDDAARETPARHALERAIAGVHGVTGTILWWRVQGPLSHAAAQAVVDLDAGGKGTSGWTGRVASGDDFHVDLPGSAGSPEEPVWLALGDAIVPDGGAVQFLAAADGSMQVRLNGAPVFARAAPDAYVPESDRFEATFSQGRNRVILHIDASAARRFHVRFRRKSSSAEREEIIQAVLGGTGSAERGGAVFFDEEKSQCVMCHRIGDRGGRIGPELTGLGIRFSKIHIIESILEPGRAIAPSFGTVVVTLKDGTVLTGVRVAETEDGLVLGDREGKLHELAASMVNQILPQPVSLMPEGLEKRLTQRELIDLVVFLLDQKTIDTTTP